MRYLTCFLLPIFVFPGFISGASAQEIERLWSTEQLITECKPYHKLYSLKENLSDTEAQHAQNCFNIVDTAVSALNAANGMQIARNNQPLFCLPKEFKTSDIIFQILTQKQNGLYVQINAGDMISHLFMQNYRCY